MTGTRVGSEVERDVLGAIRRPGWRWLLGLAVSGLLAVLLHVLWGALIVRGLGLTGLNNPVGWAVLITNFVFWVGIAHSGTLISAVLFLFRARFRTSFNRSAEAMTVFAILVAGMFPLIHLGRVWVFYFLLPYPIERLIWPNFRSPLPWDVFAVTTYLIVSVVFFYVGMIPDLALARRHLPGLRGRIYAVLSLGWQGTGEQWRHYARLYLFLAAFATPLVASVHSIVSWDFAVSIVPGWHTTIFAPYFVAGAILSGTAMVLTLSIPMRRWLGLEAHMPIDHYEGIAKILLFTSLLVGYTYVVEQGLSLYGPSPFERDQYAFRAFGPYRGLFWLMVVCNAILPLTLFLRRARRSLPWLFVLGILVNVGMWTERFVLIVASLSHDFDPYAWGTYSPTRYEIGITAGSFGLFFLFFLLFSRLLPVIAITESKQALADRAGEEGTP
ncbi:MAG TPA: NrfD/PsrC family molybdoenzyme membrane anchor subunit [Anaeromyxobacteraceae bacterium]|nr:NrfD/PsrC family molybdoenzyme membrane anchor subunit [Anaeromyxobacteraceae bacterium]